MWKYEEDNVTLMEICGRGIVEMCHLLICTYKNSALVPKPSTPYILTVWPRDYTLIKQYGLAVLCTQLADNE